MHLHVREDIADAKEFVWRTHRKVSPPLFWPPLAPSISPRGRIVIKQNPSLNLNDNVNLNYVSQSNWIGVRTRVSVGENTWAENSVNVLQRAQFCAG